MIAPLGMLVVSGLMLLDLRRDAWEKAELTSRNLLQVIERDIARNVEIIDLSLQAVVENLRAPDIEAVSPAMRRLVLFDRAAAARDMGVLLVIDERGDIAVDAGALPPRRAIYADRGYFRAHKESGGMGLHVGGPLVSRLNGERMLPFSRRISKPDGSFGGVVLGTLKLSYFPHLLDRIGLGREGAISLYLRDGTLVMRHPPDSGDGSLSSADDPAFQRFLGERSGSFVATSARGGTRRHHAFTQVGDLPLVLDVAVASDEIAAAWRTKAAVIGAIVLSLCGLTVTLAFIHGRELRRRDAMQAELARLSCTDALTGLPNRRRFEQAFERAWRDSDRSGEPLALLVVDADHFKRVNDRYGHAVGDEVLKGLARCLLASAHRPGDLACRIGGEEFVVLLPDTDAAEALRIARRVHETARTLALPSAAIDAGAVTVSIGLATGYGSSKEQAGALFRAADAALYEAKAGGRNQTRCAADGIGPDEARRPLRLVRA